MFRRADATAPNLLRGLAAGVIGGLVASAVMEQFQALWSFVGERLQGSDSEKSEQPAKPTTVKAADAITERVVGHKVRKKHQKLAGEAVHYAMGGASGAAYGILAEVLPAVKAADGAAFGAVVWLAADEATLPALGLTKNPDKIPASTHVYALASHLVYGVVTEAVRRCVRRVL